MAIITTPLLTHSGVRDVFITEENKFAIVVTVSGIEYINLYTGQVVSRALLPTSHPPLCTAVDWTTATGLLYVGTSGGGIYATRYHPARAPGLDFTGSLTVHYSTATSPPISDNVVFDLDAQPARLLIGTASGLDFIANNTRSTRAILNGTRDVHFTENIGGYWTTTSSVEVNYTLLSTTGTGIIGVDFAYTTTTNPALPGPGAVDLAIAESVPRTLAFATSSGVLVLEEVPLVESTAQRKTFTPPNEFDEIPAPQFIGVDFSPSAEYGVGSLYATTTGVLRVFRLSDDTLVGTHPQNLSTAYNASGGIARGQTLVTGTVGIVRTTSVP